MAKVGSELIEHKGSGKTIACQINFYTKDKVFRVVNFPKDIEDWNGAKKNRENPIGRYINSGVIQSSSYDGCVKEANRVFSEFHDQNIKEEKIILYYMAYNNPDVGVATSKNISFAPSTAIGLQFKIMYRITVGEESFLSPRNYEESKRPEKGTRLGQNLMFREDGNHQYYKWEKVAYTEELHEFFSSTVTTLLNLTNKVVEFFGSESTTLLENINSGVKLIK